MLNNCYCFGAISFCNLFVLLDSRLLEILGLIHIFNRINKHVQAGPKKVSHYHESSLNRIKTCPWG